MTLNFYRNVHCLELLHNERKHHGSTNKPSHKRALCLGPSIPSFISHSNTMEQKTGRKRDDKSRALGREASSALSEMGKDSTTPTLLFVETKSQTAGRKK